MIRFGADRLASDPALLGPVRRVALCTNDAARTATDPDCRTRAALLAAGVPLVRLFAPEHGLSSGAPDGRAVADATDMLTGLPVVSLYGERVAPPEESLSDIDAVLFDVPDVGVRFYTYLWTLTHVIDAAAAARVTVFVLDRPNPLGGALDSVEGPLLDLRHASFIGRHSIPIRYGLTIGEVAQLWRNERRPDADVRVITCENWQREPWQDTALPFVPTSPGLPNLEAVQLYGGLCLFEATNLSVGRGSDLSFRAVGSPWLDAERVIARFQDRGIDGMTALPASFTPGVGPHAGERCNAVLLRVQQPARLRPVAAGLALLADIAASQRGRFEWAAYPTAANPSGTGHLELLAGRACIREFVDASPQRVDARLISEWTAAPGWAQRWRSVQLYG